MRQQADPVSPRVTFDSYVIPETVHEEAKLQPVVPITGMMMAVTAISLLTFMLGVMATMKFARTGPEADVAVAVASPTVPVLPQMESEEEVTRQRAPDLISTGPTPTVEPAPNPQPVAARLPAPAAVAVATPQRKKLTVDELTLRSLAAQAIVNRNKLRMLREGVLAGVYTVKAHEDNGIRRLVLTTVNAEMTRASMGNLLLEAAAKGELEISSSLSTASGGIDMDTMLFNLIQTSLMTDGTPEGAEAAIEMSRRAFAQSEAKTDRVKGQRVYVVQAGDSLAYISLQFYGRPNAYDRIFEANRETLKSPDLIRIGQRLIIPG